MLTFVEYVKSRLEELGISGNDLAMALGYESNGLVYRVLKGEQKPPLKRIHEWARALKLDEKQTAEMKDLAEREHVPLGIRARLHRAEQEVDRLRATMAEQKKVDETKDEEIRKLRAAVARLTRTPTPPRGS